MLTILSGAQAEQRDYLLHALDVTREHDQQHMDWLLSDAAENEPDRVDQSAAKRALTLADQLAVLLPTPDASCRSASLSRRSGDAPRRGPRPARACHYFASL